MTLRTGILAEYFSEGQLAAELNVDLRTTRNWRKRRTGPPFVMRGRQIEYPIEGVRDWLRAGGTQQAKKRPRAAATRGRVAMSVAD